MAEEKQAEGDLSTPPEEDSNMDPDDGFVIIHRVMKDLKRSRRDTDYAVKLLPEDSRPTPTVQMRISTVWQRKDGTPPSDEKPEYFEIPSYKLAFLIQENGERRKQP